MKQTKKQLQAEKEHEEKQFYYNIENIFKTSSRYNVHYISPDIVNVENVCGSIGLTIKIHKSCVLHYEIDSQVSHIFFKDGTLITYYHSKDILMVV